MGVNLSDLVPGKQVELQELTGKTIAIDAYNSLYQFLSIIRDRFTGEPLKDSKGRITSHLSGIFYRTAKLLENGLDLVYVFDGEPPEFKKGVVEERSRVREEAREKLEIARKEKDIEKIRLYSQASSKLTDEMVSEAKKVLEYMGIPVVQAPSEGEAEAAYLAKKGLVWASGSQDFDSLLFGTPRMVKNLSITGRRKVPRKMDYIEIKPELIELENVLKQLGINYEQLIALGILVGSVDYNEPTIVYDEEGIRILPIGKFYNPTTNNNIKVPCFDFEKKEISFHPLLRVIKHPISEPLYEVKLEYGRKVRVTASHSLFVKRENRIEAVKTTEITPNDKVAIPVKLPHTPQPLKKINLAYEIWRRKRKIIRGIYCSGKNITEILKKRLLNKKRRKHQINDKIVILTKFGRKRIRELRTSKHYAQNKIPKVSESSVYNWESSRANPTLRLLKKYLYFFNEDFSEFICNKKYVKKIERSTLERAILSTKGIEPKCHKKLLIPTLSLDEVKKLDANDIMYGLRKNSISSILKITPELMRLIGYYIAEGNLNEDYRVSFSFGFEGQGHEDRCVKDVCYCTKKSFGVNPYIYKGRTARHICIDNIVIHSFFAHVLGLNRKNSRAKYVPTIIFNVSPRLQLEFLKGYFLGDGAIGKGMIIFATRSKRLANDISYLLLQLGIISSYGFKGSKHYNMNSITVCGKDQLKRLKSVWSWHNSAKKLESYCRKLTKKKSKLEIENHLGFAKVKSIKIVKPTNKYVYDFSVNGENFIAGFGGICCHNTDYNPGGIKGIGPKKALALVKEHKTLESVMKQVEWDFETTPEEIFEFFKSPPTEDCKIKRIKPDFERLKGLMLEHDFSKERVDKTIDRLKKSRTEKSSCLDKWLVKRNG